MPNIFIFNPSYDNLTIFINNGRPLQIEAAGQNGLPGFISAPFNQQMPRQGEFGVGGNMVLVTNNNMQVPIQINIPGNHHYQNSQLYFVVISFEKVGWFLLNNGQAVAMNMQ